MIIFLLLKREKNYNFRHASLLLPILFTSLWIQDNDTAVSVPSKNSVSWCNIFDNVLIQTCNFHDFRQSRREHLSWRWIIFVMAQMIFFVIIVFRQFLKKIKSTRRMTMRIKILSIKGSRDIDLRWVVSFWYI